VRVTQPLALVYYRKLMPGSQLVNRLHDLNYRVQAITEPAQLLGYAQTEGPMLIFADLEAVDTLELIARLRGEKVTGHIPIVAFGGEGESGLQAAQQAGATLVVGETALLTHLPGLLEQALRVE
jgi:PleD family two-component response regulator